MVGSHLRPRYRRRNNTGWHMRFVFYQSRLFEWVATAAMLGIAFEVVLFPNSVSQSSLALVTQMGLSPFTLFILFAVFGFGRLAALILNGYAIPIGPAMRASAAMVAAFVWGQLCVDLLHMGVRELGLYSLGIPIYFAFTMGEIISCFRASKDAGLNLS